MGIVNELNKDFESRVRLGIMSVLYVNDLLEFKELKDILGLTDGNLSSHANYLASKDYINIYKEFVKNKPRTTYSITKFGKKAFSDHVDQLAKLINK